MTVFEEIKHNRDRRTGRFAEKVGAAQSGTLTDDRCPSSDTGSSTSPQTVGATLNKPSQGSSVGVVERTIGGKSRRVSRHGNPDGTQGGWVECTAHVDPTATVESTGYVLDRARVCGKAAVRDLAVISDDAEVSGRAIVRGSSTVSGSAHVGEYAIVEDDAVVSGCADVSGWAIIAGNTVVDGVSRVNGFAVLQGDVSGDGWDKVS